MSFRETKNYLEGAGCLSPKRSCSVVAIARCHYSMASLLLDSGQWHCLRSRLRGVCGALAEQTAAASATGESQLISLNGDSPLVTVMPPPAALLFN